MIQEKFTIAMKRAEDIPRILSKLEKHVKDIRDSKVYRESASVCIQIMMTRIPSHSAAVIGDMVSRSLPRAIVTGVSLTLFGDHADSVYLSLNCSYFKEASVTLLEHVGRPDRYDEAGRKYGRRIAEIPHVKGVEILCAGLNSDVSAFVDSISEENPKVPFFGALAGMFFENPAFRPNLEDIRKDTEAELNYYVLGNRLYENGIVMVVFSGKDLHLKVDYLLGWRPLGKELTITDTPSKTCVAKIDNIPATEIYEKYLHVKPDSNFMENVCEFPFIVERNGCLMARVPPMYETDGRIHFNADIRKGEKIRLSYANSQELLKATREASDRMWEFHPEGIYLSVCGIRTIFLKELASQEIEDYRRIRSNLAVSYGSGEIYRFRGQGGVLNSSLVAVGFREGSIPEGASIPSPDFCSLKDHREIIPLSTRLATFLDTTTGELKEKNQKLVEMAEAAKAASTAKSQFLSNMSHEIRTPINAILGMDEMILRECRDPQIIEYAENIRAAGTSLLGLVNDILDFSKVESGKMDIIKVEYDLSSVLNDLHNMIRPRAEKKNLALYRNISPDLPSILYGDEIRLKQIITNILTNAVKYTEQGSVTMTLNYEKTSKDTILMKCSVTDTGIGIKEEDLEKLFSAFERIEEERTRTIEGTGLGMNITQQLLNLMGSKLEVKSVYGKGSTFSFTLEQKVINWNPLGNIEDHRQATSHHVAYQEAFVAPDAQILVVDDTAMNLTVIKGLLKQTQVQIDTVESGYECLHMITEKKYDIIFLDHRMPGIDGIETLHHMRTLEGNLNQDTPVISLTANAVSGAREIYIAAGFCDYLTKPIDSRQLELMMMKYLPPEKMSEPTSRTSESELPTDLLISWFTQVGGLDVKAGIRNCGSEEAYLDALTIFAESITSGADEIKRYFEHEDWKNYTTKVHALKSSARIIGAQELSDRALRLEDAGNAGYIEEIKSCTGDLLKLYLSYTEKLAPLLEKPKQEKKDRPPIEAAALAEAYEAMGEIAHSFDYDSLLYVLQSLEDYELPEADAARLKRLKAAASKPDWEEVLTILKE